MTKHFGPALILLTIKVKGVTDVNFPPKASSIFEKCNKIRIIRIPDGEIQNQVIHPIRS